jgi:hypothetical protein
MVEEAGGVQCIRIRRSDRSPRRKLKLNLLSMMMLYLCIDLSQERTALWSIGRTALSASGIFFVSEMSLPFWVSVGAVDAVIDDPPEGKKGWS